MTTISEGRGSPTLIPDGTVVVQMWGGGGGGQTRSPEGIVYGRAVEEAVYGRVEIKMSLNTRFEILKKRLNAAIANHKRHYK